MFVPGHVYRRRTLHEMYGGQQQGGISTPARRPLVLLFTGESGEPYGYKDGWQEDGLFYYTGEGQSGNMRLVAGNRAILDHSKAGKDLHLFEQAHRAHVRYIGQFICSGFHNRMAPTKDGGARQTIVFELIPIEEFADSDNDHGRHSTLSADNPEKSLGELRELAIRDSAEMRDAIERKALSRKRSDAVKQYVLKRAMGICEGCKRPAPFITPDGNPYLEPHHIRRLSDGGPDHPRWVVAVCANCHRRAHHSCDAIAFNQELGDLAGRLEAI